MTNKLFLDTSYAVALSAVDDKHHDLAVRLSAKIEAEDIKLVTTRAILFEIGNSLSKQRFRTGAVALLDAIEDDKRITIIEKTNELYHRAFKLFRDRPDKEWGLVDCFSFVVMQELNLTEALTADKHFIQAGFTALLIE